MVEFYKERRLQNINVGRKRAAFAQGSKQRAKSAACWGYKEHRGQRGYCTLQCLTVYRRSTVSAVCQNSDSVWQRMFCSCVTGLCRRCCLYETRSRGTGIKFLRQVLIRRGLQRDSKGYSACSVVCSIIYIGHNLALDTG